MCAKQVESSSGAQGSGARTTRQPDDPLAWEKLLQFIAPAGVDPALAYRQMRERLIKFFAWRGNHNGEDLADETLTRVALKLVQSDVQADRPAAFVIGVARLIDLEHKRREGRHVALPDSLASAEPSSAAGEHDEMLAALQKCLQEFSEADRLLLLRYHEPRGEQRTRVRQAIADELKAALGALRVRMHRMRSRVEACVGRRLAAAAGNAGNAGS